MIGAVLCGCMLIVSLMRVAAPIGQRMTGETLGVIPLGFRERLRLQRVNVYCLGVGLLLGTVGGWLRAPLNIVIVLAAYVIVSIPVQYTFTTAGIARNRVVYRGWDEFSGWTERTGGITLDGVAGAGMFPILLAPGQYDDARRLLATTPLGARATTPISTAPTAPKRGKGKRRRAATA